MKNATRNFQFDFALIKFRKFKFPHQQTTWMMLTCVTWLVSPNLLCKFELEELEFNSACVIANLWQSRSIILGCFQLNYFQLLEELVEGKLSSGTLVKLNDHPGN